MLPKATGYTYKRVLQYLLVICLMCVIDKFTKCYGMLLFAPMALWALNQSRAEKLMFLVMLMLAMTMGNQFFMPKNFMFGIATRGTLSILAALLATRIFGQRSNPILKPMMMMMVYVFYMIIPSCTGYAPAISFLKIALFSFIFLAFYGVANKVSSQAVVDASEMRSIMLAFSCFFVLGSLAILPFPGISMLNAQDMIERPMEVTSLFKGMTMHSQSLGPTVAVFSTFVFADMMFSIKKMDRLYVLLLVTSPVLIYYTSSRTAFGSYFAGMMTAGFFFMKARGIESKWKRRMSTILYLVGVFCVVGIVFSSSARQKVGNFALKGAHVGTSMSVFDTITRSRHGLYMESMRNFSESPLLGNGFQVNKATALVQRESWRQYLSAPVEKGVWFAAVLEEGGVVGFGIFVTFLFISFSTFIKHKAYISLSVLTVITVSNLGEFTFFSMSYTGGILWAMMFAAMVMDSQRLKEAKHQRLRRPLVMPMMRPLPPPWMRR